MDGHPPIFSHILKLPVHINICYIISLLIILYKKGHFLGNNWKSRSIVLDIAYFPHPHSGDNIARKIVEILDEWGISTKIICVTSDRGPNYVKACKYLKGQSADECFTIEKNKTIKFHLFCGAHVVQSVV